MFVTYLPCLSLHSDHFFLLIASLCQTPALSIWGFGSAPLPVLLNHRKISSTFMKLPEGCQSEEMLEFGMGLLDHWTAWKVIFKWDMKVYDMRFMTTHTGAQGTSRNQWAMAGETGGKTFTIPFFVGKSFFFFNPWDACGCIFGQPGNLIFTSSIPDTGKDWRQEEKGTTEDEMVGWHHRLNGHEFG